MKGILMRKQKWLLFLISLCFFLLPFFANTSFPQAKDPNKVYKVAILPFLIHSQENLDYLREGIYDILSTRITVEGRIVVVDRSLVERALYEERPMRLDEAVAARIGMRVGADYIVLGSLTKVGNYISLDARLISVTEEKPPLGVYTQHKGIDDVMVKIGDFAQEIGARILGRRAVAGRQAEPRHPYLVQPRKEGRLDPEGIGFKRSQTLNFEIKGVDIGDVDGDKKNELVAIDNHSIYIFKYDGERLNLFQHIDAGYYHNFLTLDVADVNGNGIAEIIVTSVVEDDVRSFIIEFEEGKFRKITEKAGWFFRVLDHPKEGPILMGQRRGSEGIAVGPIYRFIWKKREFERGPVMPFPKDVPLFGVAMADVKGEGKQEIVFFDYSERLKILSQDGKSSWVSSARYGGTANFYETLKKKDEAFRPQDAPPWRVYIPGRILIRDLDGDGMNEIIVNKNEFSSGTLIEKVRIFEKGEIHSLLWEGDGLATNWKTREIKGYIADYQVRDIDNDGEEELVVAVVNVSSLTDRKTTSNILFFKLF